MVLIIIVYCIVQYIVMGSKTRLKVKLQTQGPIETFRFALKICHDQITVDQKFICIVLIPIKKLHSSNVI